MAGAGNPQATFPVGSNVYQTSSNLYNQAAMGPNIGQFMNPYTGMVTGTALQDLERQRQIATNTLGQQASAAGAFGGSRHGVAMGQTNAEFARQGARTFADLQQQGFNTALNAAQNQQNIQSNLAGQGFQFGQNIANQQAQQGLAQQMLNQQLADAIKAQYSGFTSSPANALNAFSTALGASQTGQQTQTTTKKPGLFDYLSLAANTAAAFAGSDIRLKKNIKPLGEIGGVKFYSWDWNEEGEKVALPNQPTQGVIADELALTHPQHVMRGDDGYLRVNYGNLIRELEAA